MLAKFVGMRKVRAVVAVLSSLMLVMATAATVSAAGGGTWSVSAVTVVEGNNPGNGNTTSLNFVVHYARAASDTGNVRVHYATSNGTATGGTDCTNTVNGTVDYRTAAANTGNLDSDPGQASYDITVAIPVCGDTNYEANETLTLTLTKAASGGSNTVISATNGAATGTITNDDSQTTVTSSSLTSSFGQGVTFTANVLPATATGGLVTFFDGATNIGTCTLAAGTCTSPSITNLTVATHQITATWAGANPFGGSTSAAIAQVVSKATSSTVVTSSLNPSTFGAGVVFTANVTPAIATGGTVTFLNGGASMSATCTLNAGTCASASITNLTVGPHQITATWAGTGSYNGSTSPAITQTVNTLATTTTVLSSVNPTVQGHPTTFTATVTSVSGTPTGTITFYDGINSIGTCTLSAGTCTLATSSLSVGTHSMTAGYGGATTYSTSTSGAVAQVVTAYGPATKLVWGQAPTDVFTGTAIAPSVTVIVEDTYGNTVLNSNAPIGIAIQTGTGTLSGGTAINPVNGVATFSGLSIDTAGAFALRASSAGLTSIDGNLNVVIPLSVSVYKEICPTYGLVPGNATPTNIDQTGGHGADLGPGSTDVIVLPAGCQPADGWQIGFGPSGGTPVQYSPPMTGGTVTFNFNVAAVELARSSGHLWISEVTNPSLAGFAAIRCTGDMLNGDNVEQLNGVTDSVTHVDCEAFNVKQTIDFAAVGNQTIGVAPISLSATATSGLQVSFSTQAGDPCSVSGGVLTLSGIGTCHVIASQAGQATIATGTAAFPFWSPAFDVMQTITIAPIAQTIAFNQPADVTYGVAPFDLTATAPGGPVTFTLTGGTCSVTSTGTVTVLGAGSCIITADQAGGGNYAPAPSVTRSFTINPAVLTVTADDKTMTYGGSVPTLTSQISGYVLGENSSVITGVAGLATAADSSSHVGGYPITVDVTAMSATNYTFTGVNGTLTVGPASQSITFNGLDDKTYGDPTFDLSASAPDGSVTFTATGDCTVSGNTVTITGAGSCDITANQIGGGDYTAAPPVTQSFNIAKAVLTVTADNLSRPYGQANPTLTYTITGFQYTDTDTVVTGSALLDTSATTTSNVGPYPITVDLNDLTATNYTFTKANGTLTITQATGQTIDFGPLADKTYGGPSFTVSATATSGLPVTFTATGHCDVTGDTVSLGSIGLCTITAHQGGTVNWAPAADVAQSFNVLPAVLTIQAQDKSMAYGDPVPTLTAAITGYVNGDTSSILSGDPSLTTSATSTSGVGTYTIAAAQGTLTAPNYTFTAVDGTLTVGTASQKIAFGPLDDKTYGDPTFDLTATAPGGPVTYTASGDCTVSGNTVTITGAGSCTITADQAGDKNWDPAPSVSQTFTIDPAVLTVTAVDKTMPFGGTVPALTYTIGGYVNGEDSSVVTGTPTLATTADSSSHGGTYPITVDVSGMSAANYTFSGVSGTLTVEPIAQLIDFGPLGDKTYGDPTFDLTATAPGGKVVFTASGDCTVSGTTVTITGAGSCTITANQPGDADYTAAPPVSQSFDIGQAHLTATADDKTMVFGGSVPPLTYTLSGFVNGDTAGSVDFTGKLILYTDADSSSSVGLYDISDSTFNLETDNYIVHFAMGHLTITQADQTISFANPGSKPVNAAPFALGATASSGLTVAYVVNSGPCSVDTSGTLTITGAGDCSVTASQAGDLNFSAATPVTQVFNIGKLNQTITFVNPGTQTAVTPPFDLGATASSGLPVTYKVNKVLGVNSSCTVSGSIVTITGAGFCNITASQPGDATYNAAPNVTRNFLINKLNQTITFATLPNVAFGVTPITLTATASSSLPITYIAAGHCTVSGNVLTITGIGGCLVTATQPGNGSYWPAIPVIRGFTIAKGDQVITFANPGPKTYGDAPFNLGATAPGGPVTYQVTGGTCTVDAAGVLTIHSTGDCTVVASQAGNANYNAAPDVSQTFTVGPASPEIDVTCPVSVVFDGSAQTPPCTATLKGPGMADTDVTGSIVFSNNVGVGTATASAHWDGNSNYLPADGSTTFQIVATGSEVTIDCPTSVPYTGSAIKPCTATATGAGMDPVTLTGDQIVYSDNLNAGTATVSASWGGSTTNGGNSSSTTFEITKADLTVTANDQTMAVGDTTFDLGNTGFTPTGLLGSDHVDTAHLTSSGANPAAAMGAYDINVGSAEGVGLFNYNISYVKGTLTVTDKFVLTITADDKTRDYKKANPTFTYHISGYQGTDDDSVVTTNPTCSTTATTASLPGTYHITCSGADAASGKYVFNYVIGTLTVSGNVVGGVTAPPTATSNGGNTPNGDPIPFFALFICVAFGGLGLLAAQVQRKSTRA